MTENELDGLLAHCISTLSGIFFDAGLHNFSDPENEGWTTDQIQVIYDALHDQILDMERRINAKAAVHD